MSQSGNTELITPQEVPVPQTDDRYYRRLGLIVLGLLVGIFGIWGSLAPLSSAIPASGKVSVASSNRIVQHLEGGIVKAIPVKDGDAVHVGQTLMELDTTQTNAQLQITLAQYYENLGVEARLIAEREGKNVISFDPALQKMPTIMEIQRSEFRARAQQLLNEKQILTERMEQSYNQIEGLEAIVVAKTFLSKSYTDEIKELEVLYAQQLIDKNRLRDIKRDKMRVDSEIANAKSDISRVKAQISEVKAQIMAQKQNFIKEVTANLSEVNARLSDIRPRLAAMQDTVKRSRIKAPVAGIVANLEMHTVGGVIAPGRPILEIVPEGEPLIIEAKVMASDITNVHVGLKAEIRFPGFAHVKSLNIVEGEVMQIAPDSIVDERTMIPTYAVRIRVTPEGQQELQRHHLTIQPGIPAEVMIVTASRTFLEYMIHPFKSMFSKAFNEQ